MRTLLHMPFDPSSRFVRLALAEKNLTARLVECPPWGAEGELARFNPANATPVLIEETPAGEEIAASPASAIVEYLEEVYPRPSLAPGASAARAEVRRLVFWFESKFEREVNAAISRQRIDARKAGIHTTDIDRAAAQEALAWHLDYFNYLCEQRSFLACAQLTAADLAAAAHLSVNDYLGVIVWRDYPDLKAWYARMKSRPSMRAILSERIIGMKPPPFYDDPDF